MSIGKKILAMASQKSGYDGKTNHAIPKKFDFPAVSNVLKIKSSAPEKHFDNDDFMEPVASFSDSRTLLDTVMDCDSNEEDPFNTDDDKSYQPSEADDSENISITNSIQYNNSQEKGQEYDDNITELSPEFSPITPKNRAPSYKKNVGKKRLAFPKEWTRNVVKRLHNTGKSYVNSKGKPVEPKKLKTGCGKQCRKKCSTVFTNEKRQLLFENFWEIGNKQEQWNFIATKSKTIEKKSMKLNQVNNRRTCSRKYFLPLDTSGIDYEVCSKMFLNTLGITWKWVETAHSKENNGYGFLSPDKRGKYQRPVNELKNKIKIDVMNHIKSFPLVESHYTRKRSSKLYINEGSLNCAKMYRLYEEKCLENSELQKTNLRQYRDIFNSEFNISFFVPKADQCNKCTYFQNLNEEEKASGKEAQDLHLFFKGEARKLKDEDKKCAEDSNGRIVCACYDFQKILTCPNGDVSAFYYKRKFAAFNFTVYDMSEKEAFCYLWDESIAKKGANEVVNCLHNFITQKVANGCKEFRFWSDNCPGQNRNKTVFCFYSWISYKYSVTIQHRFLEKGHTQNEGDSVHAIIERAKKGKTVFVPMQWYTIIRNAKVSGKPYQTIEMVTDDYDNFDEFAKKINFSTKPKMYISEVREIHLNEFNPFAMLFKYDFREKDYQKNILYESESSNSTRGRKKIAENPYNRDLTKLYKGQIPISLKKKKDLVSLCESNYIPKLYHTFYKNLKDENMESSGDESNDEN